MFDAARFLKDHYTDADGIVGLLSAYGFNHPPKDTVRKWFERGVIPAAWLPVIIAVHELDGGAPLKLAPYITVGRK